MTWPATPRDVHLAIADVDTTTVSSHPSRDVAYAELVMFLEATGQRLRVVAAGWTRADYEVLGRDDRLIGHAAIDELCACTHAARDHDETGCTAISFDAGVIRRVPVCRPPAGLHRARLVRTGCTDMTAEPNPRPLSLVAQTPDFDIAD
jgi:hypothetical protein